MADCALKRNLIWPDECRGDCKAGVCLPLRKRSYLFFWTQAAACACAPGRRPTREDHATLEEDFPDLPLDGYTIVGEPDREYNCIGWSRCSRIYRWPWPQPGMYPTPADRMAFFDRMYGNFGWRRAADCSPERGKRKIALYCKDGEPTHAAKQLRGDQWTSKLGSNYRVVHVGTGALAGPLYGEVCRCYEKSLADALAEARALVTEILRRINAGDTTLGDALNEAQDQVRQWEADLAVEGSP